MPEKIPTTEVVKPKIELEAVAELEAPIKRIIEKIRDRIEGGAYGLIIGDDVSGRIPALILGNFIKKVAEQEGKQKPEIIFVPGSAEVSPSDASEYYEFKDRRVLIVTDSIHFGKALRDLTLVLRKGGFVYDIATIGIEYPDSKNFSKRRRTNLGTENIISGDYSREAEGYTSHTPLIYRNKDVSGVEKSHGEKISTPIKARQKTPSFWSEEDEKEYEEDEKEYDEEEKTKLQNLINRSRREANIVVDHLLNWYESRTKSSSR